MELGHPTLVEKLASRISREGALSFAAFMETALYDADFGYYASSASGIGPEGDFYTSLDVHSVFAELIGRQAAQAADLIKDPEFTIVEMGAGKGLLAQHLLNAFRRDRADLLKRVRYVLVERSPAMVAEQRRRLRPLLDNGVALTWVSDLSDLPAGSITGVMLSNELVDAFPVHRVVMRPLGLREIFVGWDGNRFVEVEAPPASPALEEYFERLGITLSAGQRAEVNLHAPQWMRQVGTILRRGIVLTIDYGHTAADLFAPARKAGTLMCYHRHCASDSPYEFVGRQDMTAHVDFTTLALAGQEAGLDVTGFTNQLHFLMGLGIESAFAGVDPESPEAAAMRNLLKPGGMGTVYKVLVQHKGLPAPRLDCLQSRPFLPDVLRPAAMESAAS